VSQGVCVSRRYQAGPVRDNTVCRRTTFAQTFRVSNPPSGRPVGGAVARPPHGLPHGRGRRGRRHRLDQAVPRSGGAPVRRCPGQAVPRPDGAPIRAWPRSGGGQTARRRTGGLRRSGAGSGEQRQGVAADLRPLSLRIRAFDLREEEEAWVGGSRRIAHVRIVAGRTRQVFGPLAKLRPSVVDRGSLRGAADAWSARRHRAPGACQRRSAGGSASGRRRS
jgi:hypothetical protein